MVKIKKNYKEKVIDKSECPICLQKIKYEIKTECNHAFCDIC